MNYCPHCGEKLPKEELRPASLSPRLEKFVPEQDWGKLMESQLKKCLFDGMPTDKPLGLACPCPKHSVTC